MLYYLLDMCDGGEVWKRLTVDGKVVGAHPSLARFWLSEVVSAMEHMHRRGLVHRDLKVCGAALEDVNTYSQYM